MFKTVAVKILRVGAVYCVFGVFGVLIFIFPWLKHSFAHADNNSQSGEQPGGE